MRVSHFLHQAAQYAAGIRLNQTYRIAAIGLRDDGALVHATNKAVRCKSPSPKRLWDTHAETRICRKIDVGSVIFVSRVLCDGTWANARPCEGCRACLESWGVRKAYYTIGPGEFGVMGF